MLLINIINTYNKLIHNYYKKYILFIIKVSK